MKTSHTVAILAGVLVFLAIVFYARQLRNVDDVSKSISAALIEHPEIDASLLKITEDAGVVTIEGTVNDAATKQLIIEQVKNLKGVSRVVDEISVAPAVQPANR